MRIFLLTAMAIAVVPALAQSSAAADPRSELLRIEQRWLEAIQHRDVDYLSDLLDDDFVDTPPNGPQRHKQDALAAPVAKDVESEKLEDLKVRLHGDVGVVTGVNVVTGKAHAYVATVRFTDVFQRRNGKWKAIAAQENVSVQHR